MKLKMMTDREWDRMVELTGGDNSKMHWKEIGTWVNDTENEFVMLSEHRVHRGFRWANDRARLSAGYVGDTIAFRPAIDLLPSDSQFSKVKEGQSVIMGTLFMNGKPVRVPQTPTWYGDITDYIPKAALEIRDHLPDPAYQIVGIRVDNALISDRNMLKNISYKSAEDSICAKIPESPKIVIYFDSYGMLEVYASNPSTSVTVINKKTDDPDRSAEASKRMKELDKEVQNKKIHLILTEDNL